ncbi:MAG: ribosomal-protein-alanine N-acetyltransferase [Desulfobulbus propionicus]|nr:MAG: ribosomal-protein-alanine N-acetyltransferase [Desulfobulbus propionicus]
MNVRPGEWSDLATLAALEQSCMDRPWSAAAIARELETKNSLCLLVMTDVEVGFGLFRLVGPEAELLRLGVRREHRRQGAGRLLLATAAEYLHDRGVEQLFLEVRLGNMAALRLYRRVGFFEYARRPAYYRDPVEDAVLMRMIVQQGDS